jgi:ribosomal protein L7/L12
MIERDVAELRARVAKLERKLAQFEKHFGVSFHDDAPAGVSANVIALVRQGDKLSAIRIHCQETGASLLEAKKLVDTLE